MNQSPDDFEALRKLLALKKYEQPPPGYFENLPDRICRQLDREEERVPSWQRFLQALTLRPAAAYSFALVACGALLGTIISTMNEEPRLANPLPAVSAALPLEPERLATVDGVGMKLEPYQAMEMASTNPVLIAEPLPSLFEGFKLRVQPANFTSAP